MTAGPAHTEHPTSTVDGVPPMAGTRAPAEQALLAALSVPDKVRLLTGAANWRTHGAPAIGLRPMIVSDGPSGVRGVTKDERHPSTCLPCPSATGATWDTELLAELAAALGAEARGKGVDVLLAPTINLCRSPLGGRTFEAYSEDPLLTGKLAAAYVRGMQSHGVGASLKHLVANESETDRNTVNSVVDEATLRELYLLPFEIAIAESDAWTLMAAYNDVNGVAATEQDHVNNGIVKGEWGYPGLIMSDWFATKTTAPSANGGLDLVMPGPMGPWGDALVAAVRAGEVDESTVDDHLRRLLLLASRVGALGPVRTYPDALPAPDSPQRREQLTRLAAQGMTVLTNRGGALPLTTDTSVALIGRHAIDTIGMGGGSAQVNPPYQISIADGLRALYGDRLTVTDGVDVRTRPTPARGGFVVDPATGAAGAHMTLYDADGAVIEERHAPTASTMVGMDDDFDATVAAIRITATVPSGGPIEVGTIGPGDWTPGVTFVQTLFDLMAATRWPGSAPRAFAHDYRLEGPAAMDLAMGHGADPERLAELADLLVRREVELGARLRRLRRGEAEE